MTGDPGQDGHRQHQDSVDRAMMEVEMGRSLAEEALRESNRRLDAFLKVSQAITVHIEPGLLMQMIVDHATRAVNVDSGAIYLLTSEDTLRLEATIPFLPSNFPEKHRVVSLTDHPHIERAIRSGRSILMPDASTATLSPAEQDVVRLRNLRSNLYLPIRLKEKSMGVLILSSTTGPRTFDEEDVLFLQGFAAHIGDTLGRVQMEEESEKLQAQLFQAQKMDSIGRLAGGVAHDFNNMLTVILGEAEIAMEAVGENDPLRNNLEEIRQAARRSAELTRQLLAFARRATISPRVVDLNETIEGMLKMLRRLIGEDIDLVWQPGSDLYPLFIDPSQIDQFLVNLCINARDAITGAGKITVETANVLIDEDYCARHAEALPGEFVMLAVSDNGCGMDPESLGQIFEPFFTTKGIGEGIGLGLATVYGGVKQNKGFINVYSEPGLGTTFKIYLPRHSARTAPEPGQGQPAAPTGHSETILLVEDEPAILKTITRLLEELGYVVIPSSTPGEAIRLAREYEGHIDLLLTDVIMPEMNGRDLARNLIGIFPDIRRLFMSGYTANVIVHQGVLDAGVHFLQKPFSRNALATKVREVLDRE